MSPMNNRLLVPRKTPGLLDLVPGAAAAYSLRSLSNSYADPVVTVRRSSDDAEEDFTASEVADGTLAAFAGAGDAFVKQWWDQSGNARHAVAAADANEPQIVDSGVVVTEEGKPALQFDGADDRLTIPSSTSAFKFLHTAAGAQVFLVCKPDTGGGNSQIMFANGLNGGSVFNQTGVVFRLDGDDSRLVVISKPSGGDFRTVRWQDDSSTPENALYMFSLKLDAHNATADNRFSVHKNGADISNTFTLVGANTETGTPDTGDATQDLAIGAGSGTASGWFDGVISELIFYSGFLSDSQRQLIEGQIAWSYSV